MSANSRRKFKELQEGNIMGIEIGNQDSVFRELIEIHLNHIDQKIADAVGKMYIKWNQNARDSIEIAKIHLYVAKVLLNNWKENEIC